MVFWNLYTLGRFLHVGQRPRKWMKGLPTPLCELIHIITNIYWVTSICQACHQCWGHAGERGSSGGFSWDSCMLTFDESESRFSTGATNSLLIFGGKIELLSKNISCNTSKCLSFFLAHPFSWVRTRQPLNHFGPRFLHWQRGHLLEEKT